MLVLVSIRSRDEGRSRDAWFCSVQGGAGQEEALFGLAWDLLA